jgi:FHS family L-fucose permease-like MFS transporter
MLGDPVLDAGDRHALLGAVDHAFLIMGSLLAALLLFFASVRGFLIRAAAYRRPPEADRMFAAMRSKWALFGATAIGLYVGAEVSIGSIMINFLNRPNVLGLSFEEAGGHLANFYWGGALCGRIVGTLLLTRVRASWLLAACAVSAVLLCGVVLSMDGPVAGYSALAVGVFNSIMFPTIFSLTLERSGVSQSSTSGLLCLAIFGGALLPIAVGTIADTYGLGNSFIVPLGAYAFIAIFAVAARDGRNALSPQPEIGASPIP